MQKDTWYVGLNDFQNNIHCKSYYVYIFRCIGHLKEYYINMRKEYKIIHVYKAEFSNRESVRCDFVYPNTYYNCVALGKKICVLSLELNKNE